LECGPTSGHEIRGAGGWKKKELHFVSISKRKLPEFNAEQKIGHTGKIKFSVNSILSASGVGGWYVGTISQRGQIVCVITKESLLFLFL